MKNAFQDLRAFYAQIPGQPNKNVICQAARLWKTICEMDKTAKYMLTSWVYYAEYFKRSKESEIVRIEQSAFSWEPPYPRRSSVSEVDTVRALDTFARFQFRSRNIFKVNAHSYVPVLLLGCQSQLAAQRRFHQNSAT